MAWIWTLNWAEVTPELIVGTCPMAPADLERIKEQTGATAVLSLQHDECLARWDIDYEKMESEGRRRGLAMARCPIRDFDPADTRRHLPRAVGLLARLRDEGHRTYVHCTAGISRAPLTVFAYLALVEMIPESRARKAVMEKRPESVPYWEAYEKARADLVAEHMEAIEARARSLEGLGLSDDGTEAIERAEAEVLRMVLTSE